MHHAKRIALAASLTLTAASFATVSAGTDTTEDAQRIDAHRIVDNATRTFNNFQSDPNMVWFRDYFEDAKGLLIVPELGKAGFILGGSGGRGVLLSLDKESAQWSQPAFYTVGSASIGLQIGAQWGEVIYVVMTDKGMDALLSTNFNVGADASIAAGPVGTGTQVATGDIISFGRAKGAFGGLMVGGSVITPDDKRNEAYYGSTADPTDILINGVVHNAHAQPLIDAISEAAAQQ